MITIKFSHVYEKFPLGYADSHLLQVVECNASELQSAFVSYDTTIADGGKYKLPQTGKVLILFLLSTAGRRLWTTIRRSTPEKKKYYQSHQGELVRCQVVHE